LTAVAVLAPFSRRLP